MRPARASPVVVIMSGVVDEGLAHPWNGRTIGHLQDALQSINGCRWSGGWGEGGRASDLADQGCRQNNNIITLQILHTYYIGAATDDDKQEGVIHYSFWAAIIMRIGRTRRKITRSARAE